MAKTQAQVATGRTRVRNGLSVTLYGAGAKGHEGTLGDGLEPGLIVAVPTAQTANAIQIEQPEGTILAGFDSSGYLFTAGNSSSKLVTSLTSISSAAITGSAAGQLAHANGVLLTPLPASGYCTEFLSALVSYTFGTAAYTGGGNVTINIGGGGSAITGLISYASSFGAGSSNIFQFVPLSTVAFAMTKEQSVNLVAASAPTQPGTAVGTIKVYTTFRIHKL